jgi:uncharacterized phage-associated protein
MLKKIEASHTNPDAFQKQVNDYLKAHPKSKIQLIESSTIDGQTNYLAWIDDQLEPNAPFTMDDLAEQIIRISREESWPVTNIKLNAIMYLTMQTLLANPKTADQAKAMYDKPFYLWYYGAVVPEIYDRYRVYGAEPINEYYVRSDYFDRLNATDYIIDWLEQDTLDLIAKVRSQPFFLTHQDQLQGWRSTVAYGIEDI